MAVASAQTSGTWQAQDIGTVTGAGHSSASGGTFTVAGSGADIWGASDAFHFYAQTLTGDGSITARIVAMTDTNGWAKAGVMIRDSVAPNAANVFLAATPEWHGMVAQQRSTGGGDTAVFAGPAATAPYWLRLIRSGSSVTASTSPDGTSWTPLGTYTTALNATTYIGLAVCSHNDGTLCTATFDNVALVATGTTSGGLPTAPTNLSATVISASQIALAWTNTSTTQTGFSVERSTDATNFGQIATGTGSSYTDSGLSPALTYYYRVRGTNSAGYGAASNVASATTGNPAPAGAWASADIGTTTTGQTSASGDAVTLTGSGRDIWNQADGFRYYYQSVGAADCEMIVRVGSVQDTNGWAKAGIMMRQSLDPGPPHAWVCVSAEHGTAFQSRATANGDTQSSAPSEDGGPPRWLKLVYKAPPSDEPIPPTIYGYVSSDGRTWTSAGLFRMSTATSNWQYIGLAVTSHNDGTLCTAQFDSVRLLTPAPAPTNFRVTHRGAGGEIDLAWDYSTTDVDSFVIRTNRDTTGSHDWIVETTVPGTARNAVITIGASDGAKVDIAAYRDFVRSPSAQIWAKPTVTPTLAATGTTSSAVSLRVTEQFGYNGGDPGPWSIERSNDGVSFVEIVSGLTVTGGTAYSYTIDYTDSGLPAGVTRYYRARERLPSGDISSYSNVVSATTTLSGASPAAPTDLRTTLITSSQVGIGWTDNATNETGYQVERSTDGTTFSLFSTVPANGTQAMDNSVAPSAVYYYRVRAVNDSGASSYSNVTSVRTSASSPAAPTNLVATPISATEIRLTWTDNTTNEYAFVVERSTDGVNFRTTTSGYPANTTTVTDTALTPSTHYYYRVQALVPPSSPYSNVAQATTLATSSPPPSGTWQSGDVGVVAAAGSDSVSGSTVTVTGGGADIWGSADAFRFRYQALTGDGSITARVVSMTDTDGWAKAGVMIRSTLTAGARNMFVAITPEWHGIVSQVRISDGGSTIVGAGPNFTPPFWVRLTRAGWVFTAQTSPDGVTWTNCGSSNIAMDETVAVGLAVTSHNQNALCAATFDNVTITSSGAPPPPPPSGTWSASDIGAVGLAGSYTASGSTITISGSGADIWGAADAFRYVWQTWTGDGVVEAQVASMGDTNGWAKAGVMIRDSATPGGANVFVALTPEWHGIVAQARSAAGGDTTLTAGPAANAPYWVRIARSGNTFTAATSPDGVTWITFATFNVTISATAQFGFAVTAHDNTQLNQAVFQDPFVGVR